MPNFLVTSIILSIVLTVVLNVVPRLFPGAAERAERRLYEAVTQSAPGRSGSESRVRVFFPWKAMLIGSVVLTLLVNVIGALS